MEFVTYLAFAAGLTARVELIINNTTGVAWIDWFGKGPNRHDIEAKAPGYSYVRQLLSDLAKKHPNIKRFVWRRIGKASNRPLAKLKTGRLAGAIG